MSLAEYLAQGEETPRADPRQTVNRAIAGPSRPGFDFQRRPFQEPPPRPFPIGPGGITGEPPPPYAGAPAPRMSFSALNRGDPSAFDTPGQYLVSQRPLPRPSVATGPAPDREPWRQAGPEQIGQRVTPLPLGAPTPEGIGRAPMGVEGGPTLDAGRPVNLAPVRGLDRGEDDLEAAWRNANARARAQIAQVRTRERRQLPRPGNPLIMQMFSNPALSAEPPPRRQR